MSQRDLFALPLCPCGETPAIRDNDVILWCLCWIWFPGDSLAESLDKYNQWREGVES